ncbi:MAG: glycosyltransferase [bacterium]
MRALFLINTFPPGYTGGAEVSAYHTCRDLIRVGVECSVLVVNNRRSRTVDQWYDLDGIPVHRVSFSTKKRSAFSDVFDRRVYHAVRTELRRLRPDLVHIHNVSGATLAPYVACRTCDTPVVNSLHDLWLLCPNNMLYRQDGSFCDPRRGSVTCQNCFRRYDFWGNVPYRRTVFAALTSNVKAFISPSQALIDQHVLAGYAPERFHLIRYGFGDTALHRTRHPALRQVKESVERHRTVVFAGGGVEMKGAAVVLRSLPMMLRHIEGLRVLIAGLGERRFLAQFRRYEPAVKVLGWVPFDEIEALYALADLTLVPSVCHENSPVVIYENFRVGTPVLGSAFGGIPELIEDGKTGYLFPVGKASALAEKAILHFARPAHERRRMRQRCVKEKREHLTSEAHIEEVLKVYREAVGR